MFSVCGSVQYRCSLRTLIIHTPTYSDQSLQTHTHRHYTVSARTMLVCVHHVILEYSEPAGGGAKRIVAVSSTTDQPCVESRP